MSSKKTKVEKLPDTPITEEKKELEVKVSPKKIEVPDEFGGMVVFEKGVVYADIQITDIKPEMDRSVHFIAVVRNDDKTIVKEARYSKDGKIIGQEVVWHKGVRSMTPEDFAKMIKSKMETGQIVA